MSDYQDLVARLREESENWKSGECVAEAATAIETLRRERDEARHHAEARLVALRETESELRDAIARAEKAERVCAFARKRHSKLLADLSQEGALRVLREHERDALRALLREAREMLAIIAYDASGKELLARIDAAATPERGDRARTILNKGE